MDSTNHVDDIRLNDATWGNGVGSTAKLNAAGTAGTVVAQRGPSGVDPFTLRYDGAQWSAVVRVAGWNSDGVLSIGQFFNGGIDELRVLQGVFR